MKPPFLIDPPIKTYQSNAYALGAVLALGDKALGILDNYFICLFSGQNLQEGARPILFSPFISPSTFSAFGLGAQVSFKANNQVELLTAVGSCLKRGFLVRLIVDEFYIPDRWSYLSRHTPHDVLVISASSNLHSLELMGYCADGRYRPSTCLPRQLSDGYFAALGKSSEAGFVAFKAELQQPLSIEPREIKRQLECFLLSRDPDPRAQARPENAGAVKLLHGLAIFDACEGYVLEPREWLDRRVFAIVAEHSQMMLRRARRLEAFLNIKINVSSAEQACTLAARLRLLSLLPKHRFNDAIFSEMARLFRELKRETQFAARSIYEALTTADMHRT